MTVETEVELEDDLLARRVVMLKRRMEGYWQQRKVNLAILEEHEADQQKNDEEAD